MALALVCLSLPLVGLAILLARPALDVHWEHVPAHFWLVLAVALANVTLGAVTTEAAVRRRDARVLLVSLAFLACAGFLGLHALATPGVLLEGGNAGFVYAPPIGLLIAAALAAASSVELPERIGGWGQPARAALVAILVAWAAVSLAGVPPLDAATPPEEASTLLRVLAGVGVALYAAAAVSYGLLFRRRRAPLLLIFVVAFVLLGEAMVAVGFSRDWHATWWEWHALMACAFGAITLGVRREYRAGHSLAAAFGGLYLEGTLEHVDRRHAEALKAIVHALAAEEPLAPVLERLRRDHFSIDELAVLERSAREVRRVDELFRPYLAPQLAARLEREAAPHPLVGEEREISALFADLAGFTSFSETRSPGYVIAMLNAYWAAAVPVVVGENDGLIERFAGDAVLVVFNAAADQPDHALRAARAALGFHKAAGRVSAANPDWPRFRVGVNSGPAVVGDVGAGEHRTFTAIGDTTNLASRLQSLAEPGTAVVSAATAERLGDAADLRSLGAVQVKGKREPVQIHLLLAVRASG